jgi:hypothetical protein
MNDIITPGKSVDECLERLEIKPEIEDIKNQQRFWVTSYLNTVFKDERKISAFKDWPIPINVS